MNVLYCGDSNIEDGLMISILSLIKNVKEEIKIYVLTMSLETQNKKFQPITQAAIDYLDQRVKKNNPENMVTLIDMTEVFRQQMPDANMETRFTPFCMLRLYADLIPGLPDRILYLDNDVICRKDCSNFYHQDMQGSELIGVLDHYGKWFFKSKMVRMDYINSGVLLLDLATIRKTGLFQKCRKMCQEKKMFMPDQSAINKLAKTKRIVSRRYNEQRKLHKNTVLQHFTTSFRLFPWFHTLTIKPWQVKRVHDELRLYEYDDILDEYAELIADMKGY